MSGDAVSVRANNPKGDKMSQLDDLKTDVAVAILEKIKHELEQGGYSAGALAEFANAYRTVVDSTPSTSGARIGTVR